MVARPGSGQLRLTWARPATALLELQRVKTGVLVRARATSSSASARDREAPWGPGVCTAAAAWAGHEAFMWEAKQERWCWRKDVATESGFGGGDEVEGKGVRLDIWVQR